MKFYYVYVLQSEINPVWLYVGFTENPRQRFKEHNQGKSFSTKRYKPFQLVHYEAYRDKADAKRRELYLKTTKGRTTLRSMLRDYLK